MRKNLFTILLGVAVSIMATNQSSAQSKLLYFWDFNTFTSTVTLPAIASLPADYAESGLSTANAMWVFQPSLGAGPVGGYCDNWTTVPTDGDTINQNWPTVAALPLSVVSPAVNNCFRARNPNDSMEILIYMPTPNWSNLVLSYGVESSSTGNGDSLQTYSYSVDSGRSWITSGSGLSIWWDTVANFTSFGLVSININDPRAYDNPSFVFRIQLSRANDDGSTGNNRFDNVSLQGDTANPSLGVPLNTISPSYTLFPNPVNNQLIVNSNMEGDKYVVITNVIGQTVISETKNGGNFTVSTSGLTSGIYYLTIHESATGNVTTMKFVKQ